MSDHEHAVAAEVSLSEDEREAWLVLAEKWQAASNAARKAEHHWPADCLAEAALIAARIAPVQAERDRLAAGIAALADEWERLADGNEVARGKPTKVAGYYRRCAAKVRALLAEVSE